MEQRSKLELLIGATLQGLLANSDFSVEFINEPETFYDRVITTAKKILTKIEGQEGQKTDNQTETTPK